MISDLSHYIRCIITSLKLNALIYGVISSNSFISGIEDLRLNNQVGPLCPKATSTTKSDLSFSHSDTFIFLFLFKISKTRISFIWSRIWALPIDSCWRDLEEHSHCISWNLYSPMLKFTEEELRPLIVFWPPTRGDFHFRSKKKIYNVGY